MDINERIDSIGEYFKLFTITKNIIYALVTLPKNWVVESVYANDEVSVKPDAKNKNSYYFMTSYENGAEFLFDTLDAVIGANLELMEKNRLFQDKINELKGIFESENIERLNTLTFNISDGGVCAGMDETPVTLSSNVQCDCPDSSGHRKDRKKRERGEVESVMDIAEKIAEGGQNG